MNRSSRHHLYRHCGIFRFKNALCHSLTATKIFQLVEKQKAHTYTRKIQWSRKSEQASSTWVNITFDGNSVWHSRPIGILNNNKYLHVLNNCYNPNLLSLYIQNVSLRFGWWRRLVWPYLTIPRYTFGTMPYSKQPTNRQTDSHKTVQMNLIF